MRWATLLLFVCACATTPPSKHAGTERLCVANARTLDRDTLTSIVIVEDRIAGLYEGEVGGCTDRIDAAGAWVLPAFHDAHVHMMSGATALTSADLTGADDVDQILERVKRFAAEHSDHAWIIGRGWTFDAAPEPSAALLAGVDARPIFLESYDGHAAWVNDAALRAAGVEGSGLLLEGAIASVEDHVPARSREEKIAALEIAIDHVLALGVTSVDDITTDPETFALYDALEARDALPIRATVSLPLDGDLEAYAHLREEHPGRFGYLKGFVDGVVEAKTAYLLEPYATDASTRGAPLIPKDRLDELVKRADGAGFRVALHCIGDAAVRMALDAFEGTTTPGHRIEHVEVADPSDLPRFAELGVTASMQPYHANPFGPTPDAGVWSRNLGAARLPNTFPWRALLDAGATLRFGSDWPVMSADPLRGLAVALTRRDENGAPQDGWNAHQVVTLEEALAAYGSGPVREGAAADLVVLAADVDPTAPRTLWRGARVRLVISRGRVRARPGSPR